MRLPPAIELLSVASARARRWVVAVQALTAGVLAAWVTAHAGGGPDLQGLGAAGAAGVALLLSWVRSRHQAPARHRLCWDGRTWAHGMDGESPVPVACALKLDLQTVILLRLRHLEPQGGRGKVHWLALEARDLGPEFPALCATLLATADGRAASEQTPLASRHPAGPTPS